MKIKRFGWQLMVGGLLVVPVLLAAHTVHAAITVQANSDSSVNGAIKSFGQKVEIRGTVNGDIMCAGQDVVIDATVHGDVLCAGQHITVSGDIDGDIRLAGQDVIVHAQVARAATVAAQNVTFESDSKVGTDVVTMASMTALEGEIARDVYARGSKTEISGTVGRDVQFEGAKLSIIGDAAVTGNVEYKSPQLATVTDSATVQGEVTYTETAAKSADNGIFDDGGFLIGLVFVMVVSAVLFGLLLVWLFPRHLTEAAALGGRRFGKALLTGLVVSLIWPFILGFTAFSIVGLPIAAFLWFFGVLVIMFGWGAAGFWLGSMLLRKSGPVARVSLGMFLLTVLVIIPFVGWLVGLIAFWFGVGMVVLRLWERRASFKQSSSGKPNAEVA